MTSFIPVPYIAGRVATIYALAAHAQRTTVQVYFEGSRVASLSCQTNHPGQTNWVTDGEGNSVVRVGPWGYDGTLMFKAVTYNGSGREQELSLSQAEYRPGGLVICSNDWRGKRDMIAVSM